MFTIKVAGFVVRIHNKYRYVEALCADYRCGDVVTPDFVVSASEEEVARECDTAGASKGSEAVAESICLYRKLCLMLPEYDAFLMHASVIAVRGRGIAFTAPSGTGKTTHTLLWKKRYPDEVTIVNGDKPIIRFCDEIPTAFGTPWAGKENLQCDSAVELTDICFIERSSQNRTIQVAAKAYIDRLIPQVLRHPMPFGALKTLEFVDRLTKHCHFWCVQCTMREEAAAVAYAAIVRNAR